MRKCKQLDFWLNDSTQSSSDVVLETRVLVSRHLEDKMKVLILVLKKVLITSLPSSWLHLGFVFV